jgi:hypothetical protein
MKIKDLTVDIPMFRDLAEASVNHASTNQNYIRDATENQYLGIITGMILNLTPSFADAYIYSDVPVNKVLSATLKYKIGYGKWQELTDPVYPYEFSIHLTDPAQKMTFRWVSKELDGKLTESKEFELFN